MRRLLRVIGLLLLLNVIVAASFAATDRYGYDPLGRLIRAIGSDGKTTEYVYDAAGNILEVRTGGTTAAPVVTSITPSVLRRGETKQVTLAGSNFVGASVTLPGASLSLSGLQIAASQIKFTLTAAADAPTGPQTLTVGTVAGSASAVVTVAPLLPTVNVDPAPLAVPPDGVARQFTIRLSNADSIDHVIALAASNTNISVSPATVTIPAGQTSVQAGIKGLSGGQSTITLTSATLGNTQVPVFITTEFVGVSTSTALPVGVVVERDSTQDTSTVTPVGGPVVGVVVGSAVRGVSPAQVSVGTGPVTLTITGSGLQTAQSVSIDPPTGVTMGTPVVNSDGSSVTVPVTVAADAPVSLRRVIVKNAAAVAFTSATPGADRVDIVRGAPEIDSIDPLFAVADTTITMTIRGRNLQRASQVLFSPSAGIQSDINPTVKEDGTELTARVAIPLSAPAGTYTVTVVTPGGTSSSVLRAANTFRVVNQINQEVTPVVAPPLGVLVRETAPATPVGLVSGPVGLTVGAVVTGLTPNVGIVGQAMTLTLQGVDLSGVTAVAVSPSAGLTLGALAVAPDGKSVAVPVTVAADAPQTVRKVKVMAGGSEVPFVSAEASQFRVSLPVPVLESITPITLQTGMAPVGLTIRGSNLSGATQVRITPSTDVAISSPPTVSSDGTTVTVNISAAANATPGPRVISVVTAAGESSSVAGAANTLTLASTAGATFTPVIAPALGVVRLEQATATPADLFASPLGVVVQEAPVPITTSLIHVAPTVGLVVGPAAVSLDNSGFAPGFTGTLVVRGHALGGVTTATLSPASGITLGTPSALSDGKQLTIPITVDAAAERGGRQLKLTTADGNVLFSSAAAAQVFVGPGTPEFDSITPILAKQGEMVRMTIRGRNFHDALAVTAQPAAGLTFVPGSMSVNATGTELTVSVLIETTALLGSRVIQVVVPGATSSGAAVPANTFTVFPP